jgi:hypothetical protein
MLIGAFGAWETYGLASANALGNWHGALAFAGGVLLLFDAALSSGMLEIEALRHPINAGIGALGGLFGLVAAITYLPSINGSVGWGLYLTIVAGFLALLASFRLYTQGAPAIPRGI